MVCFDTPTSRATSSTARPASTCFRAAIICASVCLLLDIHSSPFFRKNHTQLCANLGEQVTSTAKLSGGIYSYDNRGHVADNSQCTPQNCATGTFPVAYQYDLIGDELTATNGVGITLTETY